MRRRRLAPLLAVALTATLAPAVATSTATAAPATPSAPAASSVAASAASLAGTGALQRYVKQKPKWKRCEASAPAAFQCATIKVPLDYRAPGGKRIDLAISRIKSTAPGKRHGVLLSNPGGPGGQGIYLP
nr:alpha/beta hydrolase [Streptomyces sp. DSM 41633]